MAYTQAGPGFGIGRVGRVLPFVCNKDKNIMLPNGYTTMIFG